MAVSRVLAVAPVHDIETAVSWYERLLGRPPDSRPMPGLADWHITDSAWVQVFESPEYAGSTLLNLAVEDLERTLRELAAHGLTAGAIQPGTQQVRFAVLRDPDGNRLTLIENPAE
ncbi:VOC family protein [Streptomyces oceani]|uniref:Glyoxalase n=1 Tax=Streptomyces oceani TaxID=1075402 RepID=A0A1E7KQ27_9ACTN|nr:VOC family protein [Streptomyces oceani]OEV06052.1 glyoxalase [Streptomyces oceani]